MHYTEGKLKSIPLETCTTENKIESGPKKNREKKLQWSFYGNVVPCDDKEDK